MTDDELTALVYAMADRWKCSSCAPTEMFGQFAIEVGKEVREQCALLCEQWDATHPARLAAAIRGA